MNNPVGRGLLNGWQLSGISSMASGIPDPAQLYWRRRRRSDIAAAYFGTADVVGPSNTRRQRSVAHVHLRSAPPGKCRRRKDPRRRLHLGAGVRNNGDLVPPYNIRTPTRFNHDLTLFKNFEIRGEQKLQFRIGFFNIFNQAFANTFNSQRHQPDAGHEVPGAGRQRARTGPEPAGRRVRSDRKGSSTRHRPWPTSGRST